MVKDARTFYTPVWEYQGFQLVKRPDTPNYYITWYCENIGKYERVSTKESVLMSAQDKLIQFVKKRRRPEVGNAYTTQIRSVLDDYLNRAMEGRPSFAQAKIARDHWLGFISRFKVRTLHELTLDMQEEYMDWRRETLVDSGYAGSNGTIARELSVLRSAVRFAWKRRLLDQPCYVLSVPPPPPRDRFLRVHEVERLLACCYESHLWLYVVLALNTLQRPSAIFDLRVEQIDFGTMRINFLPDGRLQSNKRRPVVPISSTLKPVLLEAVKLSICGHVLELQGVPIRSVRKSFATACRKAGLLGVTPYTLRHTGATLLLSKGVPIRQVAGMLGHTEQKTTEIYGKHHPDYLRHAIDGIDDLYGSMIKTSRVG